MIRSEVPARWRLTTIGEIAREKPNNGIFRKNPEYLTNGSEGLPVVWVEELFRGNSIHTEDSRRVTATKSEIEKYGLKHGDVLFCRSSLKLDGIAFNNVYLGEDNAALFECHLIRVSPNLEDVSPVFLNWLLRSPQVRAVAKSKSKTATMTTIDQLSLASIPIVLPPLAEQRRIADVLDRAEALRAKRRAALAQLDSLTQSLFLDLFGPNGVHHLSCSTASLGSLCRSINDGVHKTPTYIESGVPFVTVKNIVSGALDLTGTRFISEDDHRAFTKRTKPERGDVLVTKDGTIGVPCPITTDEEFSIFVSVALIKPKQELIYQSFLVAQFQSDWVQRQIRAESKGIAIRHLHLEDFKRLVFVVPPIELQREFARRVGAVEKLKTAQRASLAELDALFSTLQHRAFRGEL